MVHTYRLIGLVRLTVLLLFGAVPLALAHGSGSHDDGMEGMRVPPTAHLTTSNSTLAVLMNSSIVASQSYFTYPDYGGLMLAHIVLMTIAWFFILPISVVLSVARFQHALVVQLSFITLHSFGLLLGTMYGGKTPDLYENNVHSKIGWIVTFVIVAQCVIGLLRLAASIGKPQQASADEQDPFLPMSTEVLAEQQIRRYQDAYRYSQDSGHFTASEPSRSQSISSMQEQTEGEERKLCEYHDDLGDAEAGGTEKQGLLGNARFQCAATRITAVLSKRAKRLLNSIYDATDCISLLLGFAAIVSGAIIYGGVFRGNNIFNGLAHTVKGGIFFWYGLLTLGRWMGCFAGIGWAWNIKPPVGVISSRKARIPSAEFVESFVIFLYGASNIWLEHLAAWGNAWSAQDFEHVSISIMFLGGGLCGMLVESKRIREFLNISILTSFTAQGVQSTREHLNPPKTYPFSMNPFPGLIILLLGLMMSSHHQASMVSTMVHKQWGTLLVAFALARAVTYILTYLAPPSSYLPSRPPSELISSFCLISGGLIFMASNKDTVAAMEDHDLHAMFPFTVTMGFTCFLMAWTIFVLAVKGWAVKRQAPNPAKSSA